MFGKTVGSRRTSGVDLEMDLKSAFDTVFLVRTNYQQLKLELNIRFLIGLVINDQNFTPESKFGHCNKKHKRKRKR